MKRRSLDEIFAEPAPQQTAQGRRSLDEIFAEPAPGQEAGITAEDIVRPAARAAKSVSVGTLGTLGDLAQTAMAPAQMLSEGIAKGVDYFTGGEVGETLQAQRQAQRPASEVIRSGIDEFTGGITAPRGRTEEVLETAQEFIGGAPLGAIRGAGAMMPKTGAELASFGTAGAGAELAEDIAPDSALAPVAGALVGAVAPQAAIRGAQMTGRVVAGATPTKMLSRVGKKKLQQDVINAAKEEGIRLPASALTESKIIQFVESRAAQSGLSGRTYQNLVDNMNKEFVDSYASMLDDISKETFGSKFEAGEVLQGALQKRRDSAQDAVRQNYSDVSTNYGNTPIDSAGTIDFIDNTLAKLGKTASPSPSKMQVMEKLSSLKQELVGGVDLETAINTKVDLNDIINYEVQGGSKQFLKGVVGRITADINKSLPKDAKRLFNEAESSAGLNAKTYRNKLINNMMRNESPEALLGMIRKPSDVMKIERALVGKKTGPIVNQIKRMKVEEILAKSMDEIGDVSMARFKTASKKAIDDNQLFLRLLDPQQRQRLDRLRTIASGVEKGKSFFNFSKSGNVMQDMSLLLAGAAGFIPAVAAPYVAGKIITSPKLTDQLTKVVVKVKKGNEKETAAAVAALVQSLKAEGVIDDN